MNGNSNHRHHSGQGNDRWVPELDFGSVPPSLRKRIDVAVGVAGNVADKRLVSIQENIDPALRLALNHIFSPEAILVKSLSDSAPGVMLDSQTFTSSKFGETIWEKVAASIEPDVILCDYHLSHFHQLQMLKTLFPALSPGGYVVIECDSRMDPTDTGPNVVLEFLSNLAADRISGDKKAGARADVNGYFIRNVASISFVGSYFVVEKRLFEQRRYEAVPLEKVATDYKVVDVPSAYPRITPHLYGSDAIKSKTTELISSLGDRPAPVAAVGRISSAIIAWGGIVYTPDGYIVEESFINSRHTSTRGPFFRIGQSDLFVSERPLDPVELMADGPYAVIKQTWDANYGHWIVDSLPRMSTIGAVHDLSELKYIVNGSVSEGLKVLHRESLELFGISSSQIVETDWQPRAVQGLVYATPSSIPPFTKSPRAISVLEGLARKSLKSNGDRFKGWDKIYVSRNAYPRRQLVNEGSLLPYLEDEGYRVVHPEQFTLAEQMSLFAQATSVIGNMGAAFSNLAFSPKGVSVFLLATEHMIHDYFYDLVCHKEGSYFALQGIATDSSAGIGSDFRVDEEEFRSVFEVFKGTSG